MALSYTIDKTQRLITITGEYAQPEEWKQLLAAILHDPQREPGFAFLRDLRLATTPVDAETVVGIMKVVHGFWPLLQPSRAAILTPREFDSAAMTAYAIADDQAMPFKVFRSYDDALEWLRESHRFR